MDKDLTKLLNSDEKATVEFKRGKEKIPLSLYESYSAFANACGGTIYLGIEEQSNLPHILEGVANAKQKRKQLFDIFNNKDKVSCCLVNEDDISILTYNGIDVIKINVCEAPLNNKPVFINGDLFQSYIRKDSGDYLLSEERIHSMLNDKNDFRFDQEPNKRKVTINDLDKDSLDLFIKIVMKTGKLSMVNDLSSDIILQRIGGVVRDANSGELVLNNGAVLFLGKSVDINSMCPNLWLDYSLVTNEDDRWNKRITNKDLSCEGNIFQFYRRAINALLENAPSPYCLEGVQDVGKRMVESILREAMANSISNLDLFDQSGLKITQTNKEVAFANSGTMLVPLEDALLGGTSKPRNPTLFSFFQAMGISDHGGYGIPSIFDLTKKIGFISPTLKENHSENRTELIINFRKQTKELSKEEEMILGIINNHQDGLSPLEIVNLSPFGRDKTRKIIESLFNLGLVKDNQKPSKGKKYFPLN